MHSSEKKKIIKAQDIVHRAFRKITLPSDKMHLQLFEYLSADPNLWGKGA